jgi:hypothetical protein
VRGHTSAKGVSGYVEKMLEFFGVATKWFAKVEKLPFIELLL